MNRSLAFPLAAAITATVIAQSPCSVWRIRVNIAGIRPVTKEKR